MYRLLSPQIMGTFGRKPNTHRQGCTAWWRSLTLGVPSRVNLRAEYAPYVPAPHTARRHGGNSHGDSEQDYGGSGTTSPQRRPEDVPTSPLPFGEV